jgi:proteasome inhibitor subunit 1 (PI31)
VRARAAPRRAARRRAAARPRSRPRDPPPPRSSREGRLAFAVHAYVLANGYKLVAAGAAAEGGPGAGAAAAAEEEVDAAGWDALEGRFAFRYADADGRGRPPLALQLLAAGARLLAHWDAGGGAAAAAAPGRALELDVARFTSEEGGEGGGGGGYRAFGDLVALLDRELGPALGLAPGGGAGAGGAQPSGRAGAAASGASGAEESAQERRAREYADDPLRAGPPRRAVGYDDAVPPGVRPPGMPRGGGFPEPPLHPGGGMLVGPGHPMFGPGRLGPTGGGGFGPGGGFGEPGRGPPPPCLPPGARWDPIAPPGQPGFHPDDLRRPGPDRPHPDLPPPGPGRGPDWDAYFG